MQIVGVQNVLFGPGGGQHDHRDAPQSFILLDLGEHFAAILFGQVQVQQNQIGTGATGILALPAQKAQGRHPILDHVQGVEHFGLFERLAGQIISTVIEAYADGPTQETVLSQIQRWQTEPYISELISLYRRESKTHPITSSWIAVQHQQRERQEVAR